MRTRALLVGACVALAAAGVLTLPADAAGPQEKLLVPPAFSLQASNGYRMFVSDSTVLGAKPQVLVDLRKAGVGEALYVAPATTTEDSMQADFGALGQIDVSFHADGTKQVSKSKCAGPVSFAGGSYEGTISFHGEDGFTSVDSTAAPGEVDFLIDVLCVGALGGSGGPGAELEVDPRARFGPHLNVVKNNPRARAHFEVGVAERRGETEILRFAAPVDPAGSFRFDPKLRVAMVHPPAPFSGRAVYRRSARPGHRWTGNLRVDLPGRDDVPMTGRNLRVTLRHARWDFTPERASRLIALMRSSSFGPPFGGLRLPPR